MSSAINGVKLANELENFEELMKTTDTFVFDCDGVLWRGETAIEGAVEVVNQLRKVGKRVFFVTNNNTKTREDYLKKFGRLGFDGVELAQVFGTTYTSALWMKKNLSSQGKVYVVGNDAMKCDLDAASVDSFGYGADDQVTAQAVTETIKVQFEDNVEAVLVGNDGHFSYTKLIKAASYLRDPRCKFVVTNEDDCFPLPSTQHVVIGTGSLVAAVRVAARREPDVVCGKPGSFMFECFSKTSKLDVDKCLMVGDNLKTDVLFGIRNKMRSMLVLSGVTTSEMFEQQTTDLPDYYMSGLHAWQKLLADRQQ